ncbi:MAG: ABC transporter substrate-binding protein [Deltaproteobacteria bacterium]|nr:ABC transporter substrate-binding protein [Deltaproteobacteria bacterium]
MKSANSILLTIALLGLASLAEPILAQGPTRIRYGVTASVAHLPVFVARDSGLFAKYGFDTEIIHVRGGALITMTIMSGSVEFSGAGAESVVAARIEGGDVLLLACPVDTDAVYLVARPEIKSAADLKGKASAVTRLGSTTHFYLRTALRHVGLDAEKDVTILQLGAGGEIVGAMMSGRVAAAALTLHNAYPLMQKGWPVLADLSKADFIYPSSCVASSRGFLKGNPAVVERFLKAYLEAIRLIKKDSGLSERVFKKWQRDADASVIKKTMEVYGPLFKPVPSVPDKGLEVVVKELARRRPVPKEFLNNPGQFRDHGPLEKLVKAGWVDQLYK